MSRKKMMLNDHGPRVSGGSRFTKSMRSEAHQIRSSSRALSNSRYRMHNVDQAFSANTVTKLGASRLFSISPDDLQYHEGIRYERCGRSVPATTFSVSRSNRVSYTYDILLKSSGYKLGIAKDECCIA